MPAEGERADRQGVAVRREGEDVREHAAVREDLRWIAGRVDEGLVEPPDPIRAPNARVKASLDE